ncbi:MAG: alpha-hydroxy acid oxidase [Pseudomonadales bacterium]
MSIPNIVAAPLSSIPSEIICARDYERTAEAFISPDCFAYLSGGSGHEVTLQNNRKAFANLAITPRIFKDVSNAHTQVKILGCSLKHPILLAPVAYQALVHQNGEMATACAAAATDTCLVSSTLSSTALEAVASAAGDERWFQLYFQSRDEDTSALVERAVGAGYRALVVTVDAALQAPSIRAIRAGFQFPEQLVPANLVDQRPVTPPVIETADQRHIFLSYMQNAPSREKLKRLVDESPVPVLVKGVLHADDARELKALGVAGIIVSNHGGRTLDGAPASLSVLPAIRQAVGDDYPLLLDSGIRSGDDVFKAIALGANAVLIGRLQVYALSVAGPLGVAHMIKLLREELALCMAMAGCASIADIRATQLVSNVEW